MALLPTDHSYFYFILNFVEDVLKYHLCLSLCMDQTVPLNSYTEGLISNVTVTGDGTLRLLRLN